MPGCQRIDIKCRVMIWAGRGGQKQDSSGDFSRQFLQHLKHMQLSKCIKLPPL